jgi:hypothetical protein
MLTRAIATGLGALLLAGCGISGDFRRDPGYAAFDAAGDFAEHREVGLSLGPAPLALARLFVDEEEPEIGAILRELRAVRVYVYEGLPDDENTGQRLRGIESGLLEGGWRAVAKIRDGSDRVSVLLRPGESGRTHGVAVIVQDSKDVVLVNLIGNVRLDLLSQYMAELNVDTPKFDIDPKTLETRVR